MSARTKQKTSKPKTSADQIAEKATRGQDISAYFTNQFNVVRPVHRVTIDLTPGMLNRLNERAARLKISRHALIKSLLSRALDQ